MSTGAGIDIEVLVQYKKIYFLNSKIFLVHVKMKFCQPRKVKKTKDGNESKNSFTGIESILAGILKSSGTMIELILV